MHNWNHILRLKKNANILRKPYNNLNEELLDFLIKFHGLKDYVIKNKTDFSKEHIKSLLRHSKNPKLIEEKLVFDANMLDNVGKQGIKKALQYGKMVYRTKENTFNYLKANIKKARFYTKLGKQLGKKQIKIMREIIN
jgi:HD superfamily phosphodiesterase